MKKIFQILAGVLLIIYVLLSLLSFKSGYSAERQLWGINRSSSYIASRLESTPEYKINQVIDKYHAFIKKYHDTVYAERAQLSLGDLSALRKNYPEARAEYQKALGANEDISAQAEYDIAKTYELEGQWDQAVDTYKDVMKKYPTTGPGFFTPMYLVEHSSASGPSDAYTYADALAFYKGIAVQNPKSKLEYNAMGMIAICQLNQKDWAATIKTMGEIMLKYPGGKALKESISSINMLSVTKLHRYDMAIDIYDRFIQKYPNHPADPLLKKMITQLQVLKNKNVVIRTAPQKQKS